MQNKHPGKRLLVLGFWSKPSGNISHDFKMINLRQLNIDGDGVRKSRRLETKKNTNIYNGTFALILRFFSWEPAL